MQTQETLIDEGLIPEIVEAAKRLQEIRIRRKELQQQETNAEQELISALDRNGYREYPFEGLRAFIQPGKTKAYVRTIRENEDEGEE